MRSARHHDTTHTNGGTSIRRTHVRSYHPYTHPLLGVVYMKQSLG